MSTNSVKQVKKNKSKFLKEGTSFKLPVGMVSVQDSIPIYAEHEKYDIIEDAPGHFSKSYWIGEVNYQTASESDAEMIFTKWRETLSAIRPDAEYSQTTYNRSVNMEKFCEETLIKEKGDAYDTLRTEMNKITLNRILLGKNGIKQDKIITIAIRAMDIKSAAEQFKAIDRETEACFKNFGSSLTPLKLSERLEMLFDIYNYKSEGEFDVKTRIINDDGTTESLSSFDIDNIRRMGLSIKDIIGPSSITFHDKHIEIGNTYARVLQMNDISANLNDMFLHDLTNQPFNLVATFSLKPYSAKETTNIISKNLSLVREEKQEAIKQARANQMSEDMINPNILEKEEEALNMRESMNKENEKLFASTLTVVVFADNLNDLKAYSDSVLAEARRYFVRMSVIEKLQEEGFNTTLPLCHNMCYQTRTLKSTSAAVFMPFTNMELDDPNGLPYAYNAISKNLIKFDRKSQSNFNGFILGSPGSGKSFAAKTAMILEYLSTDDDIIIIDPEGEYTRLANLLGGTVVKIAPGIPNHINPLDITIDSNDVDDIDPLSEKSDFILRLCEIIAHSPFGLDSVQEAIIDETLRSLYAPFYDKNGKLKPIPADKTPTLTDLRLALSKRKEPEARPLEYALRLYSGDASLNTFGKQTNIDIDNRFFVYDIRDTGEKMKPVAMFIIINSIWMKVVNNRKIGRFTRLYIDEFHLLMADDTCANAISAWYKRFRKYGGVPTGLTQNLSDLFDSPVGRKMVNNSSYVMILKSLAEDRDMLKEVLHLSDSMLNYVTASPKGQGLIVVPTAGITVPFQSEFPKDSPIYRCITSDLREIKKMEEEERHNVL